MLHHKWSSENRRLAYEMCADKATNTEIALATGMSLGSVARELAGERAKQQITLNRHRSQSERVPDSVLDDRTRRLAAALNQSFTGFAFGDPPPGFSALDRVTKGRVG